MTDTHELRRLRLLLRTIIAAFDLETFNMKVASSDQGFSPIGKPKLRLQFADRLDARPISTWSPHLLRTIIAAFDLEAFNMKVSSRSDDIRHQEIIKPKLRLVRSVTR